MGREENQQLMKTQDDPYNSQEWDTSTKRHTNYVIESETGQSETTRGLETQKKEGIKMSNIFPDNNVENNPYKVLFGQGDWTCSIAIFSGTHQGPMTVPGGNSISPTNK